MLTLIFLGIFCDKDLVKKFENRSNAIKNKNWGRFPDGNVCGSDAIPEQGKINDNDQSEMGPESSGGCLYER